MSKRVLVFGDSIAWGRIDNEAGGWVNRLQREYVNVAEEKEVQFFNLGIPSDKLADVGSRIQNEMKARGKSRYDIGAVLIAAGINDSKHDSYPVGTDIAVFKKGLQNIHALVGQKLILIGATRILDGTREFSNQEIGKYDEAMRTFSRENSLTYIELRDVLEDADYADGIHPNANGHDKIYQTIKAQLVRQGVII